MFPNAMTTLHEINVKAQQVLRTALGPVDYARYQQQFSLGSGDYTAERQASEEQETATVSAKVAEMKAAGALMKPASTKVLPMGS